MLPDSKDRCFIRSARHDVPLFHWLAERVTLSQGIVHRLSCDDQRHTGCLGDSPS
jgi:hypothetical protein